MSIRPRRTRRRAISRLAIASTTRRSRRRSGSDAGSLLFVSEPAHNEVESRPDANDTRMQQTWYANGMLWGAAATGVVVNGDLKAGIVWFAVSPKINGAGKVEGQVKKSGYLALANNNLTYPAIAIGASGRGAIAVTVVGERPLSKRWLRTDQCQRQRWRHPHSGRGPRPDRRLHELQGVRRQSATHAVGRLRCSGHRRYVRLARVGIRGADVHLCRIYRDCREHQQSLRPGLRCGRVWQLRRHAYLAGELGDADHQAQSVTVRCPSTQEAGVDPASCFVRLRACPIRRAGSPPTSGAVID